MGRIAERSLPLDPSMSVPSSTPPRESGAQQGITSDSFDSRFCQSVADPKPPKLWVIERFNERGPDGLINKSAPGAPGKLTKKHKAFLVGLVEEGPIPAIHGVVRWRACDLIMCLHEEFGLSVSDDTVYRALKELGFSHVSARPKAYKQDADAVETFKKTFPAVWRRSARSLRLAHR